MSQKKGPPIKNKEGEDPNADIKELRSQPGVQCAGDFNTGKSRTFRRTKVPVKATESSTHDVGKLTPRRNYNITPQSTCLARRKIINEKSQLLKHVASSSIWKPNISEHKTLQKLKPAKPSTLDTQCNIFDEVHLLDEKKIQASHSTLKIHDSHGRPKTTLDSVIRKPPPVIKAAVKTPATSSTFLYSTIAGSYIPPQEYGLPKLNDRPLAKSDENYTIFVKFIPNWTSHFRRMSLKLGHSPHSRTYGNGIQFMPKTSEEYNIVERYLKNLVDTEPAMSGFSCTPSDALPTKVGVRGLPFGTPISELKEALQAHGFLVGLIETIPPKGRSECLYTVELNHMSHRQLKRLYAINELLHMSGVVIEDLSKTGSVQLKPKELHKTTKNVPDDSQRKENDGWATVRSQKGRNMPALSDNNKTNKNPVDKLLKSNRYHIGTEINTLPNQPPLYNDPPNNSKTKSKIKREKRKKRQIENDEMFALATTINTSDEAAGYQDQGINAEFHAEGGNLAQGEDPIPLHPSSSNAADTKAEIKEEINILLHGLVISFSQAQEAIFQKDLRFKEIITSIRDFLEKHKDIF